MLSEALQTELVDYLERIDWTGDSERIARLWKQGTWLLNRTPRR